MAMDTLKVLYNDCTHIARQWWTATTIPQCTILIITIRIFQRQYVALQSMLSGQSVAYAAGRRIII